MAGVKLVRLTLMGESPILMHNDQLANPLNEWAIALKKVTGKRDKTEEDHLEIQRLEFLGGLYYDTDAGVHIPAKNIKKCFEEGAAMIKKGMHVKRGVIILQDTFPLIYKGPKTPNELYKAGTFVDTRMAVNKSTGARISRTRARFDTPWHVEVSFTFIPTQINEEDLRTSIENAGMYCGLCDYRVKNGGNFGKFKIGSWNE